MPKKDKRVKGCPNPNCIEHTERKKYKADDQFCKKCGMALIFVCSRCHTEIEDIEGHSLCKKCEAKVLEDGGKIKLAVKDLGRKAKKTVSKGAKNAASKVKTNAIRVKDKAPEVLSKARALARNRKVQRAAAVLADAAVEGMKNPRVKRVAKRIIKVVK